MTNFMLLFMTSMIVSRATHKEIKSEKIEHLESLHLEEYFKKYTPRPVLKGFFTAFTATLILYQYFYQNHVLFNGVLLGAM